MKTAVLVLTDINSLNFSNTIIDIDKTLFEYGITKEALVCLHFSDDIGFRKNLQAFRDTAESILVLGMDLAKFNFKEIIADIFECELIENENALSIIKSLGEKTGENYSNEFAIMPYLATVIPNKRGAFQGFMLEDGDFSLTVLPSGEPAKEMLGGYFVPYTSNKYGAQNSVTFKYFGDTDLLNMVMLKAEKLAKGYLNINANTVNLDTTLKLTFLSGIDKSLETEILRLITIELGDGLYADFETTLAERLFDALMLRKKTLSVAESFTAGRVVSEVIKVPGASKVVHEGIVSYSNLSKKLRLGVLEEDLKNLGAVSSRVAYEMALGLLNEGNCDIAISTTGIAGPKSDDTLKPVGLCFIAVGMSEGVHVYKREFGGNREEITEKAKNTALFLAINKLKNL
ncbi:MAG: nicotinamide-nucleotide amidohydrolase family protein [Clostridia bacterium]|nr:nicotinamide-nucleotide amidohydrolase family protein [Clostridia bacterium]